MIRPSGDWLLRPPQIIEVSAPQQEFVHFILLFEMNDPKRPTYPRRPNVICRRDVTIPRSTLEQVGDDPEYWARLMAAEWKHLADFLRRWKDEGSPPDMLPPEGGRYDHPVVG